MGFFSQGFSFLVHVVGPKSHIYIYIYIYIYKGDLSFYMICKLYINQWNKPMTQLHLYTR